MTKARFWIERAARKGFARAQYALASLYLTGHTLNDDKTALRWFQIATDQGFSRAQSHFGWDRNHVDQLSPESKEEVINNYRSAALQGDAKAQYALAFSYKEIIGSWGDAVYWFGQSAEQGHMAGENRMGIIAEGEGRFADALAWYKKSAEHGYDAAIYNMGRMYMNDFLHSMVRHGQIVPYDYDEAIRLESIAAGRGYVVAQYALGSHYLRGGNPEEGIRLLKAAANQDYAAAEGLLGAVYVEGRLVPQNREEGLRLLQLALDQDSNEARMILRRIYFGDGLAKGQPQLTEQK